MKIQISSRFSSEDFLEDAKQLIKDRFGSQTVFGEMMGYHRNTIANVLNRPEHLTIFWANMLADELGMDLRLYVFE